MKKFKRIFLIGAAIFGLLLAGLYWYVFVAGAPQLDAPEIVASKDLVYQEKTFNSAAMGTMRNYGVILPPGYEKERDRRYPVIFFLHGGHDNERAFYDKYGITGVVDRLYQSGKLPHAILVFPDGNDNRGSNPVFDPDYFDGPNGKVGTLIGQEMVQQIKTQYRTRNEPQFWAIGGVSSGGWGAYNIGLRRLDHFNIFFSHSGYFSDNSGPANSPNTFIQKYPKSELSKIRAYIDAGESDSNLLASTQEFNQTLQRLGVAHVFYQFPGGHGLTGEDFGWNYFRKHLTDSLGYVGEQLKRAGVE